ncbi:hypothetical protein BH23ACT5_BH23ACT5_10690 [soil metagenome]
MPRRGIARGGCLVVRPDPCQTAVTAAMVANGICSIEQVRNTVKLAIDEGVQRGIWDAGRTPLDGVTVPRNSAGDSGKPDLDLIPTDAQVQSLISWMGETRPRLGLKAKVAAFTGVHIGE